MIINSNEKCPVCNNNFTQDDDVVVCPICGTPHHRECYSSLGHCANADKHSSGFEYKADDIYDNSGDDIKASASDEKAEAEEHQQSEQNYYNPQGNEYRSANSQEYNDRKTTCPQCRAEIDKNAPFCSHCGARQSNPQYGEYSAVNHLGFNTAEQQEYENDTNTIDGKRLSDVSAVVRTNAHKFIPKFLKNKKISWNWSAFFFGPYYLFFRKMYKPGALFLAVNVIIQYVINGIYAKEISEFMSFFNANMESFYSNPSTELLNEMTALSNAVMPAMLLLFGSSLIISIIIALFADSFYRKRVIEVLDKVNSNLQAGASFNVVGPMMGDGSQLSQSDMKKIYLGRMGGTSILSPIAAYCALDIISWLVSLIV